MALPMVYGGPGRYVQGPGELSRQGRYLSWLGCAAYVLFDQGTEDRLCRQIVDGFLDDDLSEPFFKIYNGPCTEEAVAEMAKEAQAEYCDMVVGIGGGKMLDIAKAVAFYAELPLCVCPTAASMDGPCSAISVLYHEDGSFDRYVMLEKNPDLVVVCRSRVWAMRWQRTSRRVRAPRRTAPTSTVARRGTWLWLRLVPATTRLWNAASLPSAISKRDVHRQRLNA